MNKHTYDSLPTDIRNIVIEEVRNHESYASPSRVPLTRPAREFWNARVQAGSLKMVELTPSEQAFCKQQWEKELVDGWVKHQEAAGLKDARAYMDDLLKFQEAIVAKGLPQYTGPID